MLKTYNQHGNLFNLLNNAIKFTRSGQINFGYFRKDSFLEFYVSDTGIGIASKYHSKIFDTFYQVENALSRRFEGAGLGLSMMSLRLHSCQRLSGFPVGIIPYLACIVQYHRFSVCQGVPWPFRQPCSIGIAGLHELYKRC